VVARPLRLGALLAVALLPACTSSGPPPIRSHVALFRVDASALQGRDLAKEDAVTKALLDQCVDGRLSSRLHTAIEEQCGSGSTALLPRAFAKDLDYAWDQDPAPDLAIVARLKPRAGVSEDNVTGAIVGTVGWLMIGVPGYFVDDHDDQPPLALEISLYEKIARSDRDLGQFEVGAASVSSPRGGRPITARSTVFSDNSRTTASRLLTASRRRTSGWLRRNSASSRGAKYFAVEVTAMESSPPPIPCRALMASSASRSSVEMPAA